MLRPPFSPINETDERCDRASAVVVKQNMTENFYVQRRLILDEGGREHEIPEAEIGFLKLPVVVLGDPGMGKTKLTESLASLLGVRRISAGGFNRTSDASSLKPEPGKPLIIDGLDELTASAGGSAVDEVLKKLSQIGCPPFVLSCRSADWTGSTARHKILEDYGTSPVTLRLLPFSRNDAKGFLVSRDLDAEGLLSELDKRDLGEFYENPLTLTLIAAIAEEKQGLPSGRAELLDQASRILVRERNPIHHRDKAAIASTDSLLESAGAVFAHLLLSNSLGIADRPAEDVPAGFISLGDISDIPHAPLAEASLKTRLFRSQDENLLVPYHRVIAEFLAGRWLAQRLDSGLSERRARQVLMFKDGVPTALRGVHAWFGHFAPRMTEACIRTDPYGALRYGDPEKLSIENARLLLNSLQALANEDPYFRSEDWGRHAIAGLARPELKPEILELLKQPDRHIHLSSLVLESLDGSTLTHEIIPELVQLVEDDSAVYIERHNAANALIGVNDEVNWAKIVGNLRTGGKSSQRLAVETVGNVGPEHFSSHDVTEVLLQYHGVLGEHDDDDEDGHVTGVEYRLLKRIAPVQSGNVLDELLKRIAPLRPNRYSTLQYEISWSLFSLLAKALEAKQPPTAERFWTWRRAIQDQGRLQEKEREAIDAFLLCHPQLREAVQRLAFSDNTIEGAPWMALVMDLPQASRALAVTSDDTVKYLDEIASRETLSNFDIDLWHSLLRYMGSSESFPAAVAESAHRGINRHPELQRQWDDLSSRPKSDWKEQEEERSREARLAQEKRYEEHRAEFAAHKKEIEFGGARGMLYNLAQAYLGRFSDLRDKEGPLARLNDWVGEDLMLAGLSGFVATLDRPDLPDVRKIAESHARGQHYYDEAILICGVAEAVRLGRSLGSISRQALKSALAAWGQLPDYNVQRIGQDLGKLLEAAVFTTDAELANYLKDLVEPFLEAGSEHIPGLYQMSREERYRQSGGILALNWLQRYPEAKPMILKELIDIAARFGPRAELRMLARDRAASALQGTEARALWVGVLFLVDFEHSEAVISEFCREESGALWTIRSSIRTDRRERWLPLSVRQLEFVVETFAADWPSRERPSGGWSGDQNAWDAGDFVRAAIDSLGADISQSATDTLDRLATNVLTTNYRDQIRHVRASQQKLRRDTEYRMSAFSEMKSLLAGDLPKTMDDLKAFVLDALEDIQVYLRQGNTMAWKQFWADENPVDENTCRDRLLDSLRGHLPRAILADPEMRMPEAKRNDIGVHYNGLGLPIETKGQWNRSLWSAPSEQLIALYAKDYRSEGRGIYLVFWFGNVSRKKPTAHPASRKRPKTVAELKQLLEETIEPAEKLHINFVVLDVSRP
jgi:hypothetical protein